MISSPRAETPNGNREKLTSCKTTFALNGREIAKLAQVRINFTRISQSFSKTPSAHENIFQPCNL